MITEKYWSENVIVNTIMLTYLANMHINDFMYDKNSYPFEDNDFDKYNKHMYDIFNSEIAIIEKWVNDNNVSKINIYMGKYAAIENAKDVKNADGNHWVIENMFEIIDDAEFQEFMDGLDKQHYVNSNATEFGFNENTLAIGYGCTSNILIKKA